ncbi:MAG: hypothetical protein QMD77_05300 [Patescibacteria group bacterium]|nr:hypothetical protein [Patescibacteria group bacterium]
MEKLRIESGSRIVERYDRKLYEEKFLEKIREIHQQGAELSGELHTGKLNLKEPVKEVLQKHLSENAKETRQITIA